MKLCETTFKGNSRILNALYIRNKNFTQQMLETTTCSKLAPSCSSVSIRYLESASLLITAFAPAKQLSPKLQGCQRARHHLPPPFIIFSSFSIFFFYFFYFHMPFRMNVGAGGGGGESVGPRGHVSCNFHRVGGYPLFRITGSLPAPIVLWNRGPYRDFALRSHIFRLLTRLPTPRL